MISHKNEDTTYSFEYNPLRQLTAVADNLGRDWTYEYDSGDRLIKTKEEISSVYGDFIINRAYDPMSNLTELKATDDTTVGFTFDERGDLTDIDLPGGGSDEIGFGYDVGGYRTDMDMPGDVENDFHFDPAGRVDMATVDTN